MSWPSRLQCQVVRAASSRRFLPAVISMLVVVRIVVWAGTGHLGRQFGAEPAEIAKRLVDGYGFSCPYGPPGSLPRRVPPPSIYG